MAIITDGKSVSTYKAKGSITGKIQMCSCVGILQQTSQASKEDKINTIPDGQKHRNCYFVVTCAVNDVRIWASHLTFNLLLKQVGKILSVFSRIYSNHLLYLSDISPSLYARDIFSQSDPKWQ